MDPEMEAHIKENKDISGVFEVHLITEPKYQMQLFGLIENIKHLQNKSIINPRPTCAYALYGNYPEQPMMTFWTNGFYPDVFARVLAVKEMFIGANIPVIRTKIESVAHNSGVIADDVVCTNGHYFEFHFKVKNINTTEMWNTLVELTVPFGAHLFHNPYNKNLVPIVTVRTYTTLRDLEYIYARLIRLLTENDFEPDSHLEKEYSVLDDNVDLDGGWLYKEGFPDKFITEIQSFMKFDM